MTTSKSSTRVQKAGGSDAARQTVPSTLLHDLRSPLNLIIGYSEMLAEQAQEDGHDGFVPDLQKIRIAGGQLLAILNNNFQSSKILPSGLATEANPADSFNTQQPEETAGDLAISAETSSACEAEGLLLVVDDNEMNRDVLSKRLKRQGYEVMTIDNGREALAMVRKQPFDLMLLDIMMPEMDGYEVLKVMKADEALRHIPIIMISALHEVDSVMRCIEMGADDYLFKPFDPPLLKARVCASLDKKRARDREIHLFDQLQQNYKRLQELEKQRDDLTHMIIHDLRTPLTSVITGMQTLGMVGELNDTQREMMEIALRGGETLLGMINDLLDVEKLESGAMQLDYSTISISELIASAVSQVAPLAKSKELTLIQEIGHDLPPLPGDESKLRRTLVNLLGNAIKFTPTRGVVTVTASTDAEMQSIVFSVSDTGKGIPTEAFSRIFEKFGQVASRQDGQTVSTGLGLTFCKLTVEAHGGDISVESTLGQGSTFRFTIPLSPENSSLNEPLIAS